MNQELLIKQIVEEVMKAMKQPEGLQSAAAPKAAKITSENYPLGEKLPEKIYSPTGKKLSDMDLNQLLKGQLTAEDMRIAPETLEMQAEVAESVGRDSFARNLRRAAELIAVPDDRVLEIYNALRPYRSTKEELYEIASELQEKYSCTINAAFIREAAEVYEKRGRLRKD